MECHFSNPFQDTVPPINRSETQRTEPTSRDDISGLVVSPVDNSTTGPRLRQNQQPHHSEGSVHSDTRSPNSSQRPLSATTRFLDDGKGREGRIFLGESSTLAFVEVVRRVVEDAIGPCPFTTDPKQSSMLEARPEEEVNPLTLLTSSPIPAFSVAEVCSLVEYYTTAIYGIFDLFVTQTLTEEMVNWALQGCLESEGKSLIFLLVLAVGAQERGHQGDEAMAERCFRRARQLAFCYLSDGTSLLTVQSHILIALYMLNACRRNAAFLNLGIAARAACALGLHRSDSNASFSKAECRAREKAWKTLRVLDIYTSVSLGRPPATVETESMHLWGSTQKTLPLEEQIECACLRLCHISERIVTEVYHRDTVSIERVESISQHIREWAADFMAFFEIDEGGENEFDRVTLPSRLCLSHLTGAYYYGIILLTKTYLVQEVSTRIRRRSTDTEVNMDLADPFVSPCATLAVACLSSAIKTVDIAKNLTNYTALPKRIFLLVNNVFISSLVLGLAYFGNYDRSFPLDEGLAKADDFLQLMSRHDAHARRFAEILSLLRASIDTYVKQRDTLKNLARKIYIDKLFGTLAGKWSASQLLAPGDESPPGQRENVEKTADSRDNILDTPPFSQHDISTFLQPAHLWPLQTSDIAVEMLDGESDGLPESIHDAHKLPVDMPSGFSPFVDLPIEHCMTFAPATDPCTFEMV
ncbi:uncharacterized protein PV07_01898 [Cladophialophora immunda]|uniref:Xylanolytic transcriptional activator regulatory domain-containing protein n=1 Tax=Cladophialophora immunda TaxID=569365 RepID=A0A0D2CZ14_9EURO|nr:uncharacterized protein PV07_01898 [Cladophialophora immunda]KIW35185.1 hypothetical protein PV07_01898 [Cladophialophora immunda]OQV04650.1 Fungal specific transcription factor domain-containing protein [Cladophialophora immunda]